MILVSGIFDMTWFLISFLQVQSETYAGQRIYKVSLSSGGMPNCDCPDWQQSTLPCKHMFAIFTHVEGYAWERLPEKYLQSPYVTLDGAVGSFVLDAESIEACVDMEEGVDGGDTPYIPLPSRKSKLRAAAVLCRGKLQLLTDFTFLCKDVEVIQELKQKAEDALTFVREKVPMDAGLPLLNFEHRKKPDRKKSVYRNIPKRKKRPRRRRMNDSPFVSGGTSFILSCRQIKMIFFFFKYQKIKYRSTGNVPFF